MCPRRAADVIENKTSAGYAAFHSTPRTQVSTIARQKRRILKPLSICCSNTDRQYELRPITSRTRHHMTSAVISIGNNYRINDRSRCQFCNGHGAGSETEGLDLRVTMFDSTGYIRDDKAVRFESLETCDRREQDCFSLAAIFRSRRDYLRARSCSPLFCAGTEPLGHQRYAGGNTHLLIILQLIQPNPHGPTAG